MLFTKLTTALAVADVLVEALPNPSLPQRAFSVQQVETGKRKFRNGAIAMKGAFAKFGKAVPAHIDSAARAAQQGSVTASPDQFDSEYTCPVSIGSNGQTLQMDFDTGSSDLWVFCSEQPSSQRSGHSIYTPSSSSSSQKESGKTWKISYGDGSGAAGDVYADTVVIGGVTATSQAVECATSVSSEFSSGDNDGLVGLAFDNINTVSPGPAATFMNTVGPSLASNLFAADLRKGTPGVYDFGFIDTSKFTGSLTYVPVSTSQGFWEFSATGITIGSTAYSDNLDVIADTGTTLMLLPNDVVSTYYESVSGAKNSAAAGGYIFPCSASLPNFGVKIGGVTHTIPGSYMNYAPYSGSNCFGGLQSSSGIGINILGDIFLKSQYVVFDTGNTRIGFAQQA